MAPLLKVQQASMSKRRSLKLLKGGVILKRPAEVDHLNRWVTETDEAHINVEDEFEGIFEVPPASMQQ